MRGGMPFPGSSFKRRISYLLSCDSSSRILVVVFEERNLKPVTRVLSAGAPTDVSSLFFVSSTRCERSPAARGASVLFGSFAALPCGLCAQAGRIESKDAAITSAQKPPRTTEGQIFAFFIVISAFGLSLFDLFDQLMENIHRFEGGHRREIQIAQTTA